MCSLSKLSLWSRPLPSPPLLHPAPRRATIADLAARLLEGGTMSTPDYYAVLGVAEDATDDEIKAAFRALARQHHPDKDAGTTKLGKTFQAITMAYGVLSHPEQRAAYDAERDR